MRLRIFNKLKIGRAIKLCLLFVKNFGLPLRIVPV